MKIDQLEVKKIVGQKAAEYVQDGMLVGLGSGSTSLCFIESLIARCQSGLKIEAVSSSLHSAKVARDGGIKVLEMDTLTKIDLTVDGADEIDPHNRMIKGGGGAHVREKILAAASDQMIVIVDESKLVDVLGKFGLPVEILPFGVQATIFKLKEKGFEGSLREHKSDNDNYLFDIKTPHLFPSPEKSHLELITIPGVVDTGFFFGLATKVLVGYFNGEIRER